MLVLIRDILSRNKAILNKNHVELWGRGKKKHNLINLEGSGRADPASPAPEQGKYTSVECVTLSPGASHGTERLCAL